MHVPAATVNAEVGEAKAQSLSYVVLLAATTAISGFLFGFDTAVINGVLLFLRRQFDLSNLQTEIAASSLLLGCLLGAAGASMVGDRYGRKKSLIFSAILFALSALGAAAANSVELFSNDVRKRLSVGMMLALFSQITGINTVLYYGSIIIKEHFPAQSTNMALVANVIIGTVNLIFTIVAMIYLDRWGRRVILMTASGGMGISLTLLVVGLNLHNISPVLMLSSILLYVSFFALG